MSKCLGVPSFCLLLLITLACLPRLTASAQTSASVIDDFEAASTNWQPGLAPTYGDSSAQAVTLTTQNASSGKQALELSFEKNEKPKAVFLLETALDFSAAPILEFDLFNPGTAASVAIALSTGDGWEWHESNLAQLKTGAQTVAFDLTGVQYKSAKTNWQFTTKIANLATTKRLAILIFPAKTGALTIDNVRTAASAAAGAVTPQPAAPPKPTATPVTPKPATKLTLKPHQAQTSQYGLLEMEIATDGVAANPFDPAQADLRVRFTSATSKTVVVPAFWYQDFVTTTLTTTLQLKGTPSWRVRFTPAEAGKWRAQAELAQPELVSSPITFTVVPSATAPGFIRINSQNPRYFAFDQGAPNNFYFPIGLNVAWSTQQSAGALQDYEHWLEQLSRNGGNIARVWMAAWSFGIEWSDTGLGNYTERQQQAWLLDQVFQLAEKHHVYILLTLINHGPFSKSVNPEWDANPYNVANGGMLKEPEEFATNPQAKAYFKRRLRYIAARWGYSPNLFAWEWWNEVNWTALGSDERLGPWISEMTKELQQFDPYQHLVSTSYANGTNTHLWQMPVLSFAQQHDYTGNDPLREFKNAFVDITKTAPNKPLLMAEHGFSPADADSALVFEQMQLHNGIWTAPFTGYAGTAMYWWWDTLIEQKNLWTEFKSIADFMQGENLATLQVMTANIAPKGAQALALQNATHALVWVRSDGYGNDAAQAAYSKAIKQAIKTKVPLKEWKYEPPLVEHLTLTLAGLKDGNYTVRWFSPFNDQWGSTSVAQVKNGKLMLPVPALQRDLAVKIIAK